MVEVCALIEPRIEECRMIMEEYGEKVYYDRDEAVEREIDTVPSISCEMTWPQQFRNLR